MINHANRVIFIHIPKCAGSSVEYYFGVKPFDWKTPNYENLTGWCPKRKIHLHHATAKQLLELDLINEKTWKEYTKFTIVRNPWSRVVSDYLWMLKDCGIHDSFENFILKKGKFKHILNDSENMSYRGDHITTQLDFISINNKIVVDNILKFENIKSEFPLFLKKVNLATKPLPHDKKGEKFFSHYSHFYKNKELELIRQIYKSDIKLFNYHFNDKRNELNYSKQIKINVYKHLLKLR